MMAPPCRWPAGKVGAVCAMGGLPRTPGRRTNPAPRGDSSSCAASPMWRMRRHKVGPRHASRGVSGSCPASISSRQSANIGVVLCATIPSAEQRPKPTSLLGQWLSERLGRPFVIENRSGAGGTVGTELVVRAPPDGYTLLQVNSSNAIDATLYDNLSYNLSATSRRSRAPFVLRSLW
jgi:hypothetical protein